MYGLTLALIVITTSGCATFGGSGTPSYCQNNNESSMTCEQPRWDEKLKNRRGLI